MKEIFLFVMAVLSISAAFAQDKPKAKHLLPNGEPDRPFTFFVKHGFAIFPEATDLTPAGKPAYFFGAGTRVEDDDKDSPLFLELEGLYHFVNGADSVKSRTFSALRINMNIYFVLLNNAVKSFRWNAGTGFGWNSINDEFINKTSKQFGLNFNTQCEMLLKHKRFNFFASYHLLPFNNTSIKTKSFSYNSFSIGMGFYFR